MSRSLRTRPTTLYAKDGLPSTGVVPRPSRKPLATEADAEDKVRNRLSMRYASSSAMPSYMGGLSHLGPVAGRGGLASVAEDAAPPVPPVPALLPTATPTLSQAGETSTPGPEAWESHTLPGVNADVFASESFDPHRFVMTSVQQQSEAGLQSLRTTLGTIHTTTQQQLKEQVFKNYTEFITISREIATFENDMLEFKELLSEWKQIPQQMHLHDPISDGVLDGDALLPASLKHQKRSAADLEHIYKAQLASLWENIEGSQRLVPYVPGRHLIAETSQFVELNAATYKPKQSIALFLLDDMLLVAVQRKRHYGSRVHLVAERCFSLSEIVVVDLKDSKDVRHALKIKHGKESFVYKTEHPQDKRALLRAFRGVGEALAAKMKKERQARAEAQRRGDDVVLADTMDPATSGLDGTGTKDAAAASADDLPTLGPWLHDVVDELAVHIALREWEQAVALVEDGRKRLANRPVSEGPLFLLVEHLNASANELVSAISAELVSPYQRKSTVVRDAALLVRLDKGREARDLLLEARSDLLRRRTRQIKYEGDVSLYISELAMLYFTLIKNTGDWYMAAFKDYKMASGFVQWASEQVRAYADTFRRQVYGVDQDPRIVQEAIDITRNCAQLLNDVGLGLGFLLDDLLQPGEAPTTPSLQISALPPLAPRERRPYAWHNEPPT